MPNLPSSSQKEPRAWFWCPWVPRDASSVATVHKREWQSVCKWTQANSPSSLPALDPGVRAHIYVIHRSVIYGFLQTQTQSKCAWEPRVLGHQPRSFYYEPFHFHLFSWERGYNCFNCRSHLIRRRPFQVEDSWSCCSLLGKGAGVWDVHLVT